MNVLTATFTAAGFVVGVILMTLVGSLMNAGDLAQIEALEVDAVHLKSGLDFYESQEHQRKEMAQWLEFRQGLWDNYVYLAFEFNLSQNSQKETQTLFFGLEKEINKINEIILQILNNLLMERRE